MKRVAMAVLLGSVWLACASSESNPAGFASECRAGESRECACAGSTAKGTQTCDATNSLWGACQCAPGVITDKPEDAGKTSGCETTTADGGTKSAKKCQVCDFDVKPSSDTRCPVAPACANGSLGAPVDPAPRDDLSIHIENGNAKEVGDGGAPAPTDAECLNPQLRLRVKDFKIIKGDAKDGAYCIIEASDGVTSEAAITMRTGELKEGDSFPFPIQQGMLWGQLVPECTANNLTLSYYCFKVVDNSTWAAALDAMGKAAGSLGGSAAGAATGYGWAFGLGGAAAQAAAAGLTAAQKDENRIRIQQTIGTADLLDLTNGRSWTIRSKVRDGCGLIGCSRDWDWEITVQAWGCADKLPDGPR